VREASKENQREKEGGGESSACECAYQWSRRRCIQNKKKQLEIEKTNQQERKSAQDENKQTRDPTTRAFFFFFTVTTRFGQHTSKEKKKARENKEGVMSEAAHRLCNARILFFSSFYFCFLEIDSY
jgi:spore germination cell wall hydrolase CwlJ-like protein